MHEQSFDTPQRGESTGHGRPTNYTTRRDLFVWASENLGRPVVRAVVRGQAEGIAQHPNSITTRHYRAQFGLHAEWDTVPLQDTTPPSTQLTGTEFEMICAGICPVCCALIPPCFK